MFPLHLWQRGIYEPTFPRFLWSLKSCKSTISEICEKYVSLDWHTTLLRHNCKLTWAPRGLRPSRTRWLVLSTSVVLWHQAAQCQLPIRENNINSEAVLIDTSLFQIQAASVAMVDRWFQRFAPICSLRSSSWKRLTWKKRQTTDHGTWAYMKFPVRFKFFWLQQVGFMHDKNRFRSQLGITFAHACRINSPNADRKKGS